MLNATSQQEKNDAKREPEVKPADPWGIIEVVVSNKARKGWVGGGKGLGEESGGG